MTSKFAKEIDPIELFIKWFKEAERREPSDYNAAALATTDSSGAPNVRMVLIKQAEDKGFVFFTNKNSVKGKELRDNPQAALCCHWKSLQKQIRIRGTVQEIPSEDADIYFSSRPRMSRIGAWASKQSEILESKLALEKAVAHYNLKFALKDIPRPDYWVGIRLVPSTIEFWKAGKFRLHERVEYQKSDGGWSNAHLYP